jgi:large subunit ribosomal protein L25
MAVQTVVITALPRSEKGSRAAKRMRDAGQLPGVIYGHKEAVIPVKLSRKEIADHLAKGKHVFNINIDGKSENVLVKEVQYDYLGTDPMHVDFARVSLDERVKVTVPVELRGTPKGAEEGGVLQQIMTKLEVECLVLEIPEYIRHNVTEMGMDSVLHVKDLVLPAGVKAMQDGELIVATVREILEAAAATTATEGPAEPEVIGKKLEEGEEAAEGEKAGAAAPAKK